MIFIGLLFAIVGFFGAILFNLNVTFWNDRVAAVIRNTFAILSGVGIGIMIIGCVALSRMHVYEYKINAHYIDGSNEVIRYEGIYDSEITASRGTYYLKYGRYCKIGVVRFDIISKRKK